MGERGPNPEIEMSSLPTEEPEKKAAPAMEYGELTEQEKHRLEIINEQFSNPKFVEIEAPGVEGRKLEVEYVVLDARDEADLAQASKMNERTVIHIPGFGSSYRANEHYEKLLALKEKKRVIVISQPSTGQSDDAPDEWRKLSHQERSFDPISEALHRTVIAVRKQEEAAGAPVTTPELSVSSSSLGSMYAVDLAVKHPETVKDLVLMHPAGVYKEWPTSLGRRWARETVMGKGGPKAVAKKWLPGFLVGKKEEGYQEMDPDYVAELEQAYREMAGRSIPENKGKTIPNPEDTGTIPEQLNAMPSQSAQQAFERAGGEGEFDLNDAGRTDFEFRQAVANAIMADSGKNVGREGGLKWRAWEALTIAKGGLLKELPKVQANTYVIYGSKDKLFPATQLDSVKGVLTNAATVETDVFTTHHDDIYQDARKYSASAGSFFDQMREKELAEQEEKANEE